MLYAIKNKVTHLFWNEDSGWGDRLSAVCFGKPEGNLPQEGEWVPVGTMQIGLMDTKCADLHKLWADGEDELVIDLLAGDHAGLTATFLVQGIADRKIDREMANTIANKLIEKRQEAFRAAGMLE